MFLRSLARTCQASFFGIAANKRFIHNNMTDADLLPSINAALHSNDQSEMESVLETVRECDLSNASSEMLLSSGDLVLRRHLLPDYGRSINKMQQDGCTDTGFVYTLFDTVLNRENEPSDSIMALKLKIEWAMTIKDTTTLRDAVHCLLSEYEDIIGFVDYLDLANAAARIGEFDLFRTVHPPR